MTPGQDHRPSLGGKPSGVESSQGPTEGRVRELVRRVEEHEVVRRLVRAPSSQVDGHIGGPDRASLCQMGPFEVGPDSGGRRACRIDEGARCRSARQRLDPDRPGPGEQIKTARVGYVGTEAREEAFASSIGQRAHPRRDGPEARPTGRTGDHPHGEQPSRASSPRDRRDALRTGRAIRWIVRSDAEARPAARGARPAAGRPGAARTRAPERA